MERANDGAQRGQESLLLPIGDAGEAYRLILERVDALVRGRSGLRV